MTLLAWLLVEISFVLLKLTRWQSRHLSFSSHKIGTKLMLLGFSWHWTFVEHATFKDKGNSLVNSHILLWACICTSQSPSPSHMQIYSKRCHCCHNREVNWRFFQNNGRKLSWRTAVCFYLWITYQRWHPRQSAHSWADDSCLEFHVIITEKENFWSEKIGLINTQSPQEYRKIVFL